MFKTLRSSSFFSLGAVIGAVFMLSACSSQYTTRGNLPDPDSLSELIVGEVHARDVAEILGTPSTFSTFGGESWYYISERVEYYAFLKPTILERKVVVIKFDKEGFIEWVDQRDNEQGRNIKFVERVTSTAGNEITFFEQVFGNIGRFNK